MARLIEETLTTNTSTSGLTVQGEFSFSLSGTLDGATVTVQRSHDSGSTWKDVDAFDALTETYGYEPELCDYRATVSSAGASTSVVIRLARKSPDIH